MQMIIPITSGIGTGPTELAAFDDAIMKAGIGNHNLIYLSSIIPPGFIPRIEQIDWTHENFGDRLYVVCAQQRTAVAGETVSAGIGWVMSEDQPSRGLFVEHEGNSEEAVSDLITQSLMNMTERRSATVWSSIQRLIVSATCTGPAVCALVAAVYKSEPW